MRESEFKAALRDLMEHEIPRIDDHTDLILSKIKGSEPVKPTYLIPALRLTRAAAILVMLVIASVTAAAYAVYQLQQPPESGIEGARDAGLVTELNLSQTLDDLTVTLNYAYADGGRLAVNFDAMVPDAQGVLRAIETSRMPALLFRIRDSQGLLVIDQASGVRTDALSEGNSTRTSITVSFDLPAGMELPETMDLTLEIVFGSRPEAMKPAGVTYNRNLLNEVMAIVRDLNPLPTQTFIPRAAMALLRALVLTLTPMEGRVSSSIVTFGGPLTPAELEATAETQPLVIPEGGIGPYAFQFTVSTLPGTVVNPMQTVEVNGTPITLEQVVVAPSKIELRLCQDPEVVVDEQTGIGKGWSPTWEDLALEVFAGDTVTILDHSSSVWRGGTRKEPRFCTTVLFDTFTPVLPDRLTLNITGLEQYPTFEEWAQLAAYINDPDVLKVNPETQAIKWSGDDARIKEAKIALGFRIEGNWTWTVDLTE